MRKCCLIISILFVLAGCGKRYNRLKSIEKILDGNPVEAGIRLDSIDSHNLNGKSLALYAILRTQVDYLSGKTIATDSTARIATDYYGSRKKGYYPAMSWYSLGCAYSSMKKDPEAIYALLKAKELFTDTLSVQYVSTLNLWVGITTTVDYTMMPLAPILFAVGCLSWWVTEMRFQRPVLI